MEHLSERNIVIQKLYDYYTSWQTNKQINQEISQLDHWVLKLSEKKRKALCESIYKKVSIKIKEKKQRRFIRKQVSDAFYKKIKQLIRTVRKDIDHDTKPPVPNLKITFIESDGRKTPVTVTEHDMDLLDIKTLAGTHDEWGLSDTLDEYKSPKGQVSDGIQETDPAIDDLDLLD